MLTALIASGGGSRCSHSVGAAHYIANYEQERYPGFQMMSGVSGGALNVAGWAQHRPEDFLQSTKLVLQIWMDQIKGDRSIFRYRVPIMGFQWLPAVFKDSVATGQPLEDLLRSFVDREKILSSGIRVRWPALNLRTAKLEVFDETTEDPVKAIMASSSFPSVFPLVRIGSDFYSDGGIVDHSPLRDLIRDGARRICVLATKRPGIKDNPFPGNVFRRLHMEFSALIDQTLFEDVWKCQRVNDEIEFGIRNTDLYQSVEVDMIVPSKELGESLRFDPDVIRRQIDLGYEDAHRYFSDRRLGLI